MTILTSGNDSFSAAVVEARCVSSRSSEHAQKCLSCGTRKQPRKARQMHGRLPDLRKPRRFTDKIQTKTGERCSVRSIGG